VPERPELDHQRGLLEALLVGAQIEGVEVQDPVVVRHMVEGATSAALVGQRVRAVRRRAHVLLFDLDGPAACTLLAVHPMLAGRFSAQAPGSRRTRDCCVELQVAGVGLLRYRDDERMGKVYIAAAAQEAQIPGLAQVGVDVLGPDFTPAALAALCAKRRDQVKNLLLDKAALDALGNAYADEALFAAGLHPKRRCNSLSAAEVGALHAGIVGTLAGARDEVARRQPPLDAKLRDFLVVRNRKGAPCTRCGAPIRVCGVNGHDAFFCAVCQPDTAGTSRIPWTRPAAP